MIKGPKFAFPYLQIGLYPMDIGSSFLGGKVAGA
jgi:hypothetical protein